MDGRVKPGHDGKTRWLVVLVLLVWLLPIAIGPAWGEPASTIPAGELTALAFEQHPGARLPLGATFRDEAGRAVRLGDFFGAKPVVLAFEYFRCPGLCGLVLDRLAVALSQVPLTAGRDYQLVAIGIDPNERPADADALKRRHLAGGDFARGAGGIHFLTGDAGAIGAVAERAGFRFRYDAAIRQFAHPAGIIAAAPDGTISRYLLGIDYSPTDLRLALVEAGRGAIAAPASHLLLLCYGYDPARGRYTLLVSRLLAAAAILSIAAVALLILVAARGAPSRRRPAPR